MEFCGRSRGTCILMKSREKSRVPCFSVNMSGYFYFILKENVVPKQKSKKFKKRKKKIYLHFDKCPSLKNLVKWLWVSVVQLVTEILMLLGQNASVLGLILISKDPYLDQFALIWGKPVFFFPITAESFSAIDRLAGTTSTSAYNKTTAVLWKKKEYSTTFGVSL